MNTAAEFFRVIPPIRAMVMHGRPSTRALAVLALVAANVIWGASAVASKAVLAEAPPMTLACLRVGIALIVLLPLVTRSGTRPSRDLGTGLMGLTGVCLFCLFQNLGLVFATAANTALINGGIPVLTALLAATFIGERLNRWQATGLLLSLAGVAVIVFRGSGGVGVAGPDSLLPLASAVSFAAYAVVGRRTFAADNTLAVVAGSTRYGFLFLLPGAGIELATMGMRPLSMSSTVLLLYLGVGCSALAFVLCGYGLAHLDAGQGSVFGNLKPIVGIILAVILLGESLTAGQVVGGGLVLLGVVLASRGSLARHRPGRLWRPDSCHQRHGTGTHIFHRTLANGGR